MGEEEWKIRPEPWDKKSELHAPNTSLPVRPRQVASGVCVHFLIWEIGSSYISQQTFIEHLLHSK